MPSSIVRALETSYTPPISDYIYTTLLSRILCYKYTLYSRDYA